VVKAAAARKPLSLRAFAKLVGATHRAVQKAITAKRLDKSVGRNASGRVAIVDVEVARREWKANARKLPNTGGGAGRTPPCDQPAEPPVSGQSLETPVAVVDGAPRPESLAEAQLQYTIERTIGEEMKNAHRRGELLESAVVHRKAFECARQIRDQLFNIPDRVAAELAAETNAVKVHARLSAEIRDALEGLADALAGGEAAA
jgi:hypothetical protein